MDYLEESSLNFQIIELEFLDILVLISNLNSLWTYTVQMTFYLLFLSLLRIILCSNMEHKAWSILLNILQSTDKNVYHVNFTLWSLLFYIYIKLNLVNNIV